MHILEPQDFEVSKKIDFLNFEINGISHKKVSGESADSFSPSVTPCHGEKLNRENWELTIHPQFIYLINPSP